MVGAYNKGPTTMNTEVLIALIAAIAAVIAAVAPKFLERKRDLEKKELQRYYMELQSCWDDLEFLLSVEEEHVSIHGQKILIRNTVKQLGHNWSGRNTLSRIRDRRQRFEIEKKGLPDDYPIANNDSDNQKAIHLEE